jgi:4-amino-4-deoxy-L-arabinose transferase-like glycosyltransferase
MLHGILLLALFVGLRFLFLTSDPPPQLVSHYQDFAFSVFDEGWWTGNARAAVLYGAMRGTGFDLFWVSPVFTLLATAAFWIGGVGLATGRVLSIAMGLISVVLLWRTGRDPRDESSGRCAGLAALLFVVAFAPAQLLRLSTPESSGIVLGLAGAASLLSGRKWGEYAAGVFASLAMLVKPHFGLLIPAFVLATLVLALRRERSWLSAVWIAVLGVATPLVVWGGYVAAHAREAGELVSFYLVDRWFAGVPPSLTGLVAAVKPAAQVSIAGVVYRHHFFVYLPFVFGLAVLAGPRVWSAAVRPRAATGVSDAAIVFGLWALVGGVAISTMPFQPLRYYLPVLPGVLWLAAWAVTRPPREERTPSPGRVSILRWGAGAFLAVQVAFAALAAWLPGRLTASGTDRVALLNAEEFHLTPFLVQIVKARSFAPFEMLPRELAHVAALALCGALALGVGGVVAVVAARPFARGFLSLEAIGARSRWIVVALLLWQATHWVRWQPAYTLPAMAREIDRIVPADATISPSGTFSLDSGRRYDTSVLLRGGMFDAEGGADYFVALASHPLIGVLPIGEIERRWPGSERVAAFTLTGDYVYHLYRSRPPDEPSEPPADGPRL